MQTNHPSTSDGHASVRIFKQRRRLAAALSAILLLISCGLMSYGQQSRQKLPAPDKVIGEYWKASGGKKRLAAVREADYEWTIQRQTMGRARVQEKAPASRRTDLTLDGGETKSAASPRSAWMLGTDGTLRTLTDAEAGTAKLQAALSASRLIDYKKLNVLARTVALDRSGSEAAYVVEFSTRAGARLRYSFGVNSKLLLKIEDEVNSTRTHFGDYRAASGLLLPHRMQIEKTSQPATMDAQAQTTMILERVRFNTNLSDALFDPPSTESLDIPSLLKEVEKNQEKLDERVAEYAFTEKRTERKINDKGEIKEEKVTVYEIYPLPGGGVFYKVISENGVPLSAERAAKQDKNIAESIARYEREREKREQKKKLEAEKNKGEVKKEKEDDDVSVAQFLNACEFVSPRRERLRERDAIVFDFRPRPGFRPRTNAEEMIAKLIGIVWIDPIDKQVIRLEAKLADGYKIGGGLVASIKPGASFVFEQTRIGDGVWLPRFAQVNFSVKLFLFKGIDANETREFSDYRHFKTEAGDYKLDAPANSAPVPSKP
ncbi:MAG TPA: hypothetical protein VF658_03835 [Pyrinomonadaceae bacterium]|jgi:hypothetical protein